MSSARVRRASPVLLVACLGWTVTARAALPTVPEGFRIRLLATVPAVESTCQVATAPDGSLFVAEDPMDQVGPYNQPIDRILVFREGKDPGGIGRLEGVGEPLRARLDDPALEVREAAINALGAPADREAIPALLRAVEAEETRYEASLAPCALPDLRALQVYLKGLTDRSPDVRKASAAAVEEIRGHAAPVLERLGERHELSPSLVAELRKIYTSARPVTSWQVLGPFSIKDKLPFEPNREIDLSATPVGSQGKPVSWKRIAADAATGLVDLGKVYGPLDDASVFGYAEVQGAEARPAQLIVGSDDTLSVWINGARAYQLDKRRGYKPDTDRVEVKLRKGTNRLVVQAGNAGGTWQYGVAVTAPGDYKFLEGTPAGGFNPDAYRGFALGAGGSPEHGRAPSFDLKGLACIKCHTVGKEGGTVGPELSTIGAEYPRDELIASVLFPSARIFQGYEPVVIATGDGRVLTGVVKDETAEALEIEDADARRIKVAKDEIEERKQSDVSIMPNGPADGLSRQDFADLIIYLETLKEAPTRAAAEGGGDGNGGRNSRP